MQLKKTILVLADISGYTRFVQLHTMSLLHAEKIITELMESILDTTSEPLRLNKLEGDAVFLYAEVGDDAQRTAQAVLDQTMAFFEAFRERSKRLTGCNNLCPCDACRQADQLRLKTIVHTGDVAFKMVRDLEELAGEPVIITHRLAKSSLGQSEFLLMTDEFVALGGDLDGPQTESLVENCEGIGQVAVEVHFPDGPEPAAKRSWLAAVANGLRLDGYALARVLKLRRVSRGAADRLGARGGVASFVRDAVRGLWMVVARRTGGGRD